jgi:hypothetical protein
MAAKTIELIFSKEKKGNAVPNNKLCKRNNRQISDNTKIAAKQGNAEERPDAGCEIKRWKAAAEMSSFFNIPPDISKGLSALEISGGMKWLSFLLTKAENIKQLF